jgi:hypothetical protein
VAFFYFLVTAKLFPHFCVAHNLISPMNKIYFLVIGFLCSYQSANAQTPINMGSQPNFSYTENFSDINNWIFSTTPANGIFTAGIGASAWKGNEVSAIGSVPSALRIVTASTFFQTPPSGSFGYSSGVYKGNQSLTLLASGTTDNSNSVSMDFFLDFTGVNAGNLSFDWNSLNNSTGNRNGSLRVYASVDGTNYTEITGAQVLNFTNNLATGGSITNVALPSSFNNSATARLRFYYHNGVGGTSGSRPRLNIDNVKVTSFPTNTCTAPTAQPTNFSAGTVINNSITFSFTPANPAPQNYLVVMSNNNTLSSNPVNNVTYSLGDNLGDGNVIGMGNASTITATGLNPSTTYYFFIFSMNNLCTGGPLYITTNPLSGNATTLAGALPCTTPPAQPTSLVFNNVTNNSISGSFTAASGTDEYIVIRTTTSSFTGTLTNGTNYNVGNTIGNGTVISKSAATSFTNNSLVSGTNYYYFVFSINSQNCTGAPVYRTSSPLVNNTSTVALPNCTTPSAQPTNLILTASNTSVNGYFAASTTADNYLVLRSTSATLTVLPVTGTNYTVGNNLGNALIIQKDANLSFIDIGLSPSTIYYYFVFANNSNCFGSSPNYLTSNPLISSVTTSVVAVNNYYYGNLHAHSSYSDGNQDNGSLTPADNYAYAKNSLCMDFLGISDHNHATAGMSINNWQPGITQATAATTNNFLALYGMEWGVISNGGHVLIYGTNQLIGWETNNYNIYVPKSDYTGTLQTTGVNGLFRTLNTMGNNCFATFAHPNYSDYNNLGNLPLNTTADSIVVGSAVASGIAFSTNTTYSDPPSTYAYIDFYTRMLSKGYHIGPLMDHDTHNTNFGRSSNNRLVVIMPSLTSANFYTAMKGRNFYATEDCDTRISFTLNNQIMGSNFSGNSSPAINVYATDPTNPTLTPTIKLMFGIAGSNILPIQIASVTASTLSYTDYALANGVNGYYYADITIGGNRTISSPIWYTKNTAVPVNLVSFSASMKSNRDVAIQWTTTQEINCKSYELQRAEDGVNFTTLFIESAKNSSGYNYYNYRDLHPNNGLNYYRLKQRDADNKTTLSKIVAININKSSINSVQVYPNPIHDYLTLNIHSNSTEKASIIVTDMLGKLELIQEINLVQGNQIASLNATKLNKGNHLITLRWKQEPVSIQCMKY